MDIYEGQEYVVKIRQQEEKVLVLERVSDYSFLVELDDGEQVQVSWMSFVKE